ncbi:MAG TPA: hypothetical protein VME47_01800 [Acetobacteraceae bacterium]|nr:hypothetical protein [Acetobacteraceae bacterium]
MQAKTVLQWDRLHRRDGVWARIALDHAAAEEVIEISFGPQQEPSWCIVRRPDGRFLVLDLPRDVMREFPSVQSAFRHILAN